MIALLKTFFGPLQILFLPFSIACLIYGVYRTIIKKDKAAGLALLIGLFIIVDVWKNTGIPLPGLNFGTIRYSEPILILLFLREWMRNQSIEHQRQRKFREKMLKLFLIYLFFFFISVIRSNEVSLYLFRHFRDDGLSQFLIFYIASSGFKKSKDYKRFFGFLFILGGIITLGSFQEFLYDRIFIDSIFYDRMYHIQRNGRFASFFGNPNLLASFYVLILPTIIIMLLESRTIYKFCMRLGLLLFFAFGLYKTFTRAAFLSFPLAVSPIALIKLNAIEKTKKITVFIIAAFALVIISPNLFSGYFNRIDTIQDKEEIENSRLIIWVGTLTLIGKNILLGAGYGEDKFMEEVHDNMRKGYLDENTGLVLLSAQMPHNSYLYILFFMGIFGLISYCLIIGSLISKSIEFYKNSDKKDTFNLFAGILCGIIGFNLMIFFDYQLFVKSTASVYWCLIGLSVAIINRSDKIT